MKILVAGTSGLIGTALVAFLREKGHEVKRLVRHSKDLREDEIAWDPDSERVSASSEASFDAVVNLAGDRIFGRWSADKKKKILDSRVKATRTLCIFLTQLKHPPKVLVNASAIGYYGNRGKETLTEGSESGSGFLANVCREWEAATEICQRKRVRVVCLRTGVVLSEKGGALAQLLTPFKMGLGGVIGSGSQYMSWILLEDLVRVILYALENESLSGPVNAVSPFPVTNLEFTQTLGACLHRPTFFPLPAFAARLLFGEMADDLLLSSTNALPKKLSESGFVFLHPTLKEALVMLLSK